MNELADKLESMMSDCGIKAETLETLIDFVLEEATSGDEAKLTCNNRVLGVLNSFLILVKDLSNSIESSNRCLADMTKKMCVMREAMK